MPLLNPGYWPATYWAENYWGAGYWPEYGVEAVIPGGARRRRRRRPLSLTLPLDVRLRRVVEARLGVEAQVSRELSYVLALETHVLRELASLGVVGDARRGIQVDVSAVVLVRRLRGLELDVEEGLLNVARVVDRMRILMVLEYLERMEEEN